jgi:hypothetical protein
MIVRINEARQKQKPAEVDIFTVRLGVRRTSKGGQNTPDAVATDMHRGMRSLLRPEGATNSANYLLVLLLLIQVSALHGRPGSCFVRETGLEIK